MQRSDKTHHQTRLERLQRDGTPALWIGEQRFCGNFPALAAGMPGIYVPDESVPMFYPEAWKYRYGILARTENIRQTTPTNSPNT
ncbi:MAG: hypothetical protein EHM81_12030 [Chloroflexi bacterium]|nr:MAG: hypothetical protein EHM81_12030 [Chloroflexota bacterium]